MYLLGHRYLLISENKVIFNVDEDKSNNSVKWNYIEFLKSKSSPIISTDITRKTIIILLLATDGNSMIILNDSPYDSIIF